MMTRTLRKLAVALGLGMFPVIALAGAASAQVGPPAPSASSTTTTTAASTSGGTSGSGSNLPFTGSETGPLVVLGIAALGGGYAVVHARRRVDGPQA